MSTTQPNTNTLLSTLRNNPDLPVTFTLDNHAISPGYHITEVKFAVVNSLDCGQGTDRWRELVIQLLDGNTESSKTYMQSKKWVGILDKAINSEQVDESTKLYFEFTPANAALQKSSIKEIDIVNKTIAISLTATTAQCKPYQRALASGITSDSNSGCCGTAPKQNRACCDTGNQSTTANCCT